MIKNSIETDVDEGTEEDAEDKETLEKTIDKNSMDQDTLDDVSDKNKDFLESLWEQLYEVGSKDTDIVEETEENAKDEDTKEDSFDQENDVNQSTISRSQQALLK